MTADVVNDLSLFLLGQGELTPLIGQRLYPNRIPENGKLPCVVIQQISGGRDYSMSGPTGLYWPRVQLTCWAYTAAAAHAVASAVEDVMDALPGAMPGTVTFTVAFQKNRIDGDEPPQFANDRAKQFVILDYQVRFRLGD